MIFLNIGEPDFTAPPLVQEAAARAIRAGTTQYTQATGLTQLRERISGWYAERFGIDVPARRIVVTAGASAALQLACLALIDAGDEILMPDPSYPCNRHFVSAADGRAVLLPTTAAERFQLSAAKVEAAWDRAHARRAAGLAVEPDRHLDRARTSCAASTRWCRGAAASRWSTRSTWACPYDEPYGHSALAHRRPGHQHQQLQQVLQHDRLAPGLAGGARRPGAGGRAAGAEPLHLREHGVAARGAGLLRAREHRRIRAPPRASSRPGATGSSRISSARPDGAGGARRRLLCLGRLQRVRAQARRRGQLGPRLRGHGHAPMWR